MDDNRAQWLNTSRGIDQDIKFSTPLADNVMAQLVADTLADLDAQQFPNRSDVVVTSVADNVFVVAPVALVLIVDAAIAKSSRTLRAPQRPTHRHPRLQDTQ